MTAPRAALVHLGRPSGMGETRRVAGWRAMLEAAGARVEEISLLGEHRRRLPSAAPGTLVSLLRRGAVLETAAWDVTAAAARLRGIGPDLAVFVTARAFHPQLTGLARSDVLDYVDALSRAYAQRAAILRSPPRAAGYRLLQWSQRGFERSSRRLPLGRVAAGYADAAWLEADWLPIPVAARGRVDPARADHDVLFFGTLAYPPNIAALRRLSRIWPAIRARRGSATAIVAGARPTPEVGALAAVNGWRLLDGFGDVAALCARARLAVVPLEHAAGIQIKVLEAAAVGLPQVVSPAALGGMAPGLPAVVASEDSTFVDAVVDLLDDAGRRDSVSAAAWHHVRDLYSVERWTPAVAGLLAGSRRVSDPRR